MLMLPACLEAIYMLYTIYSTIKKRQIEPKDV